MRTNPDLFDRWKLLAHDIGSILGGIVQNDMCISEEQVREWWHLAQLYKRKMESLSEETIDYLRSNVKRNQITVKCTEVEETSSDSRVSIQVHLGYPGNEEIVPRRSLSQLAEWFLQNIYYTYEGKNGVQQLSFDELLKYAIDKHRSLIGKF